MLFQASGMLAKNEVQNVHNRGKTEALEAQAENCRTVWGQARLFANEIFVVDLIWRWGQEELLAWRQAWPQLIVRTL